MTAPPAMSGVVSPLETLARGEGDAPALVADRIWTRTDVVRRIKELAVEWTSFSQLKDAPLVALDTPLGAETLLRIWTLTTLGIPFVPLHVAWSAAQRRQVLETTGATLLPPTDAGFTSPSGAIVHDLWRNPASDDTLAVVFTSGSSGRPKGAALSHRSFSTSATASGSALGWSGSEVFYASLPLAHVGGLSIATRAAVLGGSIVLPASDGARHGFDPATFVERCAETQTTIVSLVPTQLRRLCTARLRAPRNVRCVLLGGAHAPQALIEDGLTLGWPIRRTYGLTEACSQVATDRQSKSSGPIALLPHVEARREPDGRLALRGDSLFSGYFGESPRRPTDWFVTSDLAEVGATTVLPLGRADDVVISGGENVHPDEVDAALAASPGVAIACTFARPSAEWGQELCAALVVETGFEPTQLLSYLRGVLPSFKIPKAWVVVTDLPVTATGKVSRRQCQELLASQCAPLLPRAAL